MTSSTPAVDVSVKNRGPPLFDKLGIRADKIFTGGYANGSLKFTSKTKSGDPGSFNVRFKSLAVHDIASKALKGRLEVKYKVPQHGLKIYESWDNSNELSTKIAVENQFTRGMKMMLQSTYHPHTAKRSGLFSVLYGNDNVKVQGELSMMGSPILTLSGVMGYKQWLLGAQTKYDVGANDLKSSSVMFGRRTPLYTILSQAKDGKSFDAKFYHTVHENLKIGAKAGWNLGDKNATFGVATRYRANKDLVIGGKIDNSSNVSVSATHSLGTTGAKLTLSTQFGLAGSPVEANRFGVALSYSPK